MTDPLGVMQAAEELWPHNDLVAGFDPDLADAMLCARANIAQPTYHRAEDSLDAMTEHMPKVRLVFVKRDAAPAPFLDALEANDLPEMDGPCDRCLDPVEPVARLWVPAGGSVVQVECCERCVRELDHDYPDLVWR